MFVNEEGILKIFYLDVLIDVKEKVEFYGGDLYGSPLKH